MRHFLRSGKCVDAFSTRGTKAAKERKYARSVSQNKTRQFQGIVSVNHIWRLRSRKTSLILEPAMPEDVDHNSERKIQTAARGSRPPMSLRASSLVVASVLSLLMITTVVPPIVA